MTEKGYIFLYPVKDYLEAIVGPTENRFPHIPKILKRLNEIIDARYRQRGYQVYWVFFGSEGDTQSPDTSQKADEFYVDPEDIAFSCGLSFKEHIDTRKYPNNDDILDQISPDIKELFIGGFHQWDCVDKVAKAAHERGIHILVDEDTTEIFLLSGKRGTTTQLIRDPFQFYGEDDWVDFANETRPDVPWFTKLAPESAKGSL